MSTSDYKMEIDNPTKEKAIKTAVNDISTDLSSVSSDLKSLNEQLPALVATRSEINEFKDKVEKYDKKLTEASTVIKRGVDVRVAPAKLSGEDVQMLEDLKSKFETWNRRWSTLCKAIASTGKIKVIATGFVSALITAAFMLLAYENSPHVWAHRALVAAEESHMESPLDDYSKAFVEMRGGIKARKDCKRRIKGMESDANKIKILEEVLSDYTEELVEVREYKISMKSNPIVDLICYHPSSNQKVNYRIYSTPEGEVIKVEMEKKIKGKKVWVELKPITAE